MEFLFRIRGLNNHQIKDKEIISQLKNINNRVNTPLILSLIFLYLIMSLPKFQNCQGNNGELK